MPAPVNKSFGMETMEQGDGAGKYFGPAGETGVMLLLAWA